MASKLIDKANKSLQELLTKAEDQGFLTLDDLMEVFPEAEENISELEDLFIHLSEEGIQVLDTEKKETEEVKKKSKGKAEAEDEEPEELEDDSDGDVSVALEPTTAANLSEIASDDTISLYLKEMARVPLLTAEQEVALARQYEEGRDAQEELNRNSSRSARTIKIDCISRFSAVRAHAHI